MAWQGVTKRTLTSAWKKLWPEAVNEKDFEGFEPEPNVPVEKQIVSLGKSMDLEVDEGDVLELLEEHSQEMMTEELQELQAQQHTEALHEIGSEEEAGEVISTSEIKELLGIWETFLIY